MSICLITLSYEPDFVRCRLLANSIDSYSLFPIQHYIIVDKKDLALFKQLETNNRTIISIESILPWWIQKISWFKNGWLSLQTLPIRNWVIQQIAKLEIVNHLTEDILVFVDSDVCFVKNFNLKQFIKNERVRLFRVSLSPEIVFAPSFDLQTQLKWRDTATSLLAISSFKKVSWENPLINYVGNLITWKRDHVLQLHQHIEKVTQRSWLKAIASQWHISEYMLYGIFVDCVLKENSAHYWDSRPICHEYWGTKPLTKKELTQFWANIPPESFAVMISAKSQTPLDNLISLIDLIPN